MMTVRPEPEIGPWMGRRAQAQDLAARIRTGLNNGTSMRLARAGASNRGWHKALALLNANERYRARMLYAQEIRPCRHDSGGARSKNAR